MPRNDEVENLFEVGVIAFVDEPFLAEVVVRVPPLVLFLKARHRVQAAIDVSLTEAMQRLTTPWDAYSAFERATADMLFLRVHALLKLGKSTATLTDLLGDADYWGDAALYRMPINQRAQLWRADETLLDAVGGDTKFRTAVERHTNGGRDAVMVIIDYTGNKPQPGFDCLVLHHEAGRGFTQGVALKCKHSSVNAKRPQYVSSANVTDKQKKCREQLEAAEAAWPGYFENVGLPLVFVRHNAQVTASDACRSNLPGAILVANVMLATLVPFANEFVRGETGGSFGTTSSAPVVRPDGDDGDDVGDDEAGTHRHDDEVPVKQARHSQRRRRRKLQRASANVR